MAEYPVVRRVFVDSGPAATGRVGEQIIVFKLEGTRGLPLLEGHTSLDFTLQPAGTITHSSLAIENITNLPLSLAPRYGYDKSPMKGNEGSDLIGVYWALDSLGPVLDGNVVEVVGDGQVFDMLQGKGRVGAKWGGKDWAPDLTGRIREAEREFGEVKYRTIASAVNPAGHLVDEVRLRQKQQTSRSDEVELL